MILQNWSLVNPYPDPYLPPECQANCLHGEVYGNPSFDEGERIITSQIAFIEEGEAKTVSGSTYQLGEIDPDYLAAYPNALEKLVEAQK